MALASVSVCLGGLVSPSGRYLMPIARLWSRLMLRALGIRACYHGVVPELDQTPRIFMANHQSSLDMLVMLSILPDNTRFLVSSFQRWIPFFGWGLMASRGCIFVGTGNLQKSRESIDKATDKVRRGHCLLVFPEGKRTRDGQMLPFKKGVFHLALAACVPIIPVAICGARSLMPSGSLAIRPGSVHVRFGDPIVPPAGTTAERLAMQTRAAIVEAGRTAQTADQPA